MTAFRILLATIFVVVFVYTMIVGLSHGWGLLPIFFTDISGMTWRGQFNMDFASYLTLSGLWLAWRKNFSPAGLGLGILGFFGGILVLAPYLLYATFAAKGDMREVLLGKARA